MGQVDKPYLHGQILMAMPTMNDPRFSKAVIYLCAHDEYGAMGLVLNQVLPGLEFGSLLEQLNLTSNIQIPPLINTMPVLNGGPVETSRGFLLHGHDFTHDDTVIINDQLCLTATVEALKIVAGGKGPKDMIFTLGYAGWNPGQLDQELQQNAWLSCNADPELIFKTQPSDMWDRAMGSLGFDPVLLSSQAGHA